MTRGLALLFLIVGCAAPPADEPDPEPTPEPPPASVPSDVRGPYQVGATTIENVDERGKWMVMEVWYPAVPVEGEEFAPYPGLNLGNDAYRDPAWDLRGAPYPVVVFSHGFGGVRFQSSYLTTWLASHGFVVIAPDHEFSTLFDLDQSLITQVAAERPRDVAVAVDLVDARLPGSLDLTDGYSIVGHSFGAWTSLVVGGGQVDPQSMIDWCAENDTSGCGFFEDNDVEEIEDISQAVPDPRAKVAVALAPGLHYSFGPGGVGLANNVPTLVQGGTRDADMSYEAEIRPVAAALPATSHLASFTDGAHFGFSDLCTTIPIGGECDGGEAGYMEIARVHELSRVLTTAWIRAHFLGEEAETAFLGSDWVEAGGDAAWE
ncbi:MAG: hypothetical protein KDA24_11380 [Deltaproteobacteria bacterium]|nr:hypothetical protein [Deltaproteobacteria bacterium]